MFFQKYSIILVGILNISLLSAKPDNDLEFTIQSAENVITALTNNSSVYVGNHMHLTPYLHELTLNGQLLPDSLKSKLTSVGYQFKNNNILHSAPIRTDRTESIGLDLTFDEGIFRFHYTLTGTNAVADINYVIQMASTFNYVYDKIINDMEFIRPPGDGFLPSTHDNGGSAAYDVYIRQLSSGDYGYVQSEYYAQNTGNNENSPNVNELNAFTSYMAMRNNYQGFPNTELENIQVTAAHEFFHAVQYGYDGWEKPWLLESTAVWVEDQLFDDINDCYQYLPSWFQYPHESLDKAGGTHWYGSYIYFQYISEHLGEYQTIRTIFEEGVNSNSSNGDFSHQAIDDALSDVNSSFSEALNNMAIANRILSSDPGFGAEKYSYEEAEDFPMSSPRIFTTIPFSEGDTQTIQSTSLNLFGSQYIHVSTSDPISVSLMNEDGPQSDLNFHSIIKTSTGYYIIKTGNPMNIDPGQDYDWLTLVVVSQDDNSYDFDYRIEITDGVAEEGTLLPFSLDQPVNGEEINTLTPLLSWHPSRNIQGNDYINYQLVFGVNPEALDTIYVGQDTSYHIVDSLSDHTLYHWSVFAENISGSLIQNKNEICRFFTAADPLSNKTISVSKPYPNPFPLHGTSISRTRLRIILQEEQTIHVSVVNILGQTINTLFSGQLSKGFYDRFSWDGRTKSGKKAPSGIYFIRVISDSDETWKKVMFIR